MAASLLGAATSGWAAPSAEFSLRWDPAEGGPKTAKEALAALGLEQGRHDDFLVQYFTVDQPRNAPAGARAIARERRQGRHVEATYKMRAPTPFTAEASSQWKCPLKQPAESKNEVDIGWSADASPRRAYSLSCSANADMAHAMPAAYGARPLGCTSKMRRVSEGHVALEVWELPRGRQLIEVSTKGEDTARDLEAFRKRIVSPLLKAGAKPLDDSKTELGSAC